ncbi:hypothetical protein RJZ56_008040, partial [Blastomyces dermatitidis]
MLRSESIGQPYLTERRYISQVDEALIYSGGGEGQDERETQGRAGTIKVDIGKLQGKGAKVK